MAALALAGCAVGMAEGKDFDDSDESDPVVESAGAAFGRSRTVGGGSGKMGMNDGSCLRNCFWEDVNCRIDAGGDPDLNRWCDRFDAQCRAKC